MTLSKLQFTIIAVSLLLALATPIAFINGININKRFDHKFDSFIKDKSINNLNIIFNSATKNDNDFIEIFIYYWNRSIYSDSLKNLFRSTDDAYNHLNELLSANPEKTLILVDTILSSEHRLQYEEEEHHKDRLTELLLDNQSIFMKNNLKKRFLGIIKKRYVLLVCYDSLPPLTEFKCMSLLLNNDILITFNKDRMSSRLIEACKVHNIKVAKAIIDNGADVNYETPEGTPLSNAARNRCPNIMDLLVRSGANINKILKRGKTGKSPCRC